MLVTLFIYSENTADSKTLHEVDRIIQETFQDFNTFQSSIVFKATWKNMAFYSDSSKVKILQYCLFYHSVLFCNDIVELKPYLLNIENKNLTKSSIAT